MSQSTQSLILDSEINLQHFPVQKGNLIPPDASEQYPDVTEDLILHARSKQAKICKIKDRLHNKQNMNLQTL